MKGSLIIVGFFVLGVVLGLSIDQLEFIVESDISMYVLYCLMFTVGIGIGCDKNALNALKTQDFKVILLPIGTILGTLLGALIVSPLVFGVELRDILGIASGFGYYSLSSIILTEYRGAEVGTIALVSNIIREIFTILAAPLLVRYFGKLSVISSAGATSLDTLLPIIAKFSGSEFVIISIFHGLVLELTVPLLVTFLATI